MEDLNIDEINEYESDEIDSQFPRLFYVTNIDDAERIIREYELKTVSKFITYRESKDFGTFLPLAEHLGPGKNGGLKLGRKILWEDGTEMTEKIPYDGMPYITLGSKIMDCMYGPDRSRAFKEKKRIERESPSYQKKRKSRTVPSRKVDCPAQIYLREIHKFPEFKVPYNSAYNKRTNSKALRKVLEENTAIGERRIYVSLPRMSMHTGHNVGKETEEKFSLDPEVRDKIFEMVYKRVFNTAELQAKAYQFVKNELFKGREPPPMTNRRYFPTARVVKSFCYQARIKMKNEGIAVPLPKIPERTKKPGPPKKNASKTVSKDEGNLAAQSLLLLDQPVREEEVDTAGSDYEEMSDEPSGSDRNDHSKVFLETAPSDLQEKQECETLLEHIKALTASNNDRSALLDVKSHLLEVVNKLHSKRNLVRKSSKRQKKPRTEPMLTIQIAPADEDDEHVNRVVTDAVGQQVEEVSHVAPIRVQRDPETNRHIIVLGNEPWSS